MPGLVSYTVAPASSRLTTLATVKDELQITDTSADSYLTRLIDQASGLIARHCGRALGSQTVAETFRVYPPLGRTPNAAPPPLMLSLPYVSQYGDVKENGGASLVLDTDFEADDDAALLWRLSGGLRTWWTVRPVVVSYVTGWQLPGDSPAAGVPALPSEVEAVCIALVRAGYNDRGRDMSVVMDQQEGVGRVQYAAAKSLGSMTLDADMAAALAPYAVREV